MAPPLQIVDFRGCPLTYRIEGEGPPMLMIQGVGAFGLGWNPQVEILRKDFACLTFDNRGIGASQPLGVPLSVPQMASDALAILDSAKWDSAHVVGHSLGGLVALQLALMAKRRVRSLSLLCTFARGADAIRLTSGLLWIGLRLRFAPLRFRRQAFMELVLPPGTEDHAGEIAQRLSAVFGHDIGDLPPITNQQVAAMGRHDVTPRLSKLSGIPTLVVSGEKDTIAPPSSGRAIAAGIPGSHYVEIAGASHALPILEAERCGQLLLEHLIRAERERLESAPAPA